MLAKIYTAYNVAFLDAWSLLKYMGNMRKEKKMLLMQHHPLKMMIHLQ